MEPCILREKKKGKKNSIHHIFIFFYAPLDAIDRPDFLPVSVDVKARDPTLQHGNMRLTI